MSNISPLHAFTWYSLSFLDITYFLSIYYDVFIIYSLQCSKKCNGGVKTRVVECVQRIAHGHIINRPDTDCGTDKPLDSRLCNPNACSSQEAVMVSDVAQKYEQATTEEDVMLKVGGEATVYRGVEMKMRCPVNKRYT
jgi:ADAMTS-like protein 1/3